MSNNLKRSFATLDGLRGVAALAVVARHTPFLWGHESPSGLFFESYLAVDFFFVLSGFVLAHAYSARFTQGLDAKAFLKARIIRLYPLYAFALALAAAVMIAQVLTKKGDIGTALVDVAFATFLLPTPANETLLFPLNFAAWSLFCELSANIAFGVIGSRLTSGLLRAIVGVAGLAVLVAVPFGLFGFHTQPGAMDAGPEWVSLVAGMLRVAFSFFMGIGVYRLWQRRLVHVAVPPALIVTVLASVLIACPPYEWQAAFDVVVVLVIFPLLVYVGASSHASPSLAPIFLHLGAMSYAAYVLQAVLLNIAMRVALFVFGMDGRVAQAPMLALCSFATVLVAAFLVDRYFDVPIRRKLTSVARSWTLARLDVRHSPTV